MPKETLVPIQYPQSQSPRRHPYPPAMHQQPPRQPSQQPPPSTAAAKAAAAAKALHRQALDRAHQKQSQPHPAPQRDPRWEQHEAGNDDRRRSAVAVFRRTDAEEGRYQNAYGRPPTHHPAQAHPGPPQSGRRNEEEYPSEGPPPGYQMPPGYPPYGMPYNYRYIPPVPGVPPNYPDEDDKINHAAANAHPNAPIHRPREDYPNYYDPRYFDPNFAANNNNNNNGYPPPFYGYPYDKNHPPLPPPHAVAGHPPPPHHPAPHAVSAPPPPPPMEEKRVKYQEAEQTQQPSGRSKRRIIGSHTPIHVPRAEDSPLPFRGGGKNGAAARSVFRSQEPSHSADAIANKERNAHEILLSLSKSFEKKEEEEEERPKSPEEPPQLKQFHKEIGDEGFEPQPSPLRPDKPTEKNENDIEFAPSFTLFNQSFDMNLENILGPNASFGLGPMKSLSFGLGGFGGSIDYSDPRVSPISIHHTANKADTDKKENVQVLRASPSNSFGNVLRVASSGSERKKGVMVLGDSVRVSSPSSLEKKRSRSSSNEKNIVLDGNARNLPFRLKDDGSDEKKEETGKLDILEPPQKKKKKSVVKASKMNPALFKIIENHQSAFGSFTFLLPGAKAVLSKKLDSTQLEIARRRINSALCAFGGSALPKQMRKLTANQQKYEQMLPKRYYEDDNRLSWEVEEDPPVEISDEEASIAKISTCDSADSSAMSLQRSMGVMVYPALNAYVAAEPGVLTPALSEMNNTINGKKSPECTPAKGSTTALPPASKPSSKLPTVSPDCVKLGPESSTSDGKTSSINYAGGTAMSSQQLKGQSTSKIDITVPDHLFIKTQDLVPEQFKVITEKKHDSYEYPSLPVPYAQRKRMSNAVFAMSKSIPGLTDECAAVLSEARKKDAWDFAVAELMTQVVVLTHCEENDWKLDGLSKYLLALGIAC